MKISLIPLNMGDPSYGPFDMKQFTFYPQSTPSAHRFSGITTEGKILEGLLPAGYRYMLTCMETEEPLDLDAETAKKLSLQAAREAETAAEEKVRHIVRDEIHAFMERRYRG